LSNLRERASTLLSIGKFFGLRFLEESAEWQLQHYRA
jgi:hypothetical protein